MAGAKLLFRYSRWLHKYAGLIGLFVLAYFFLMGVSGILLNHRSMISRLSVPVKLLPNSYVYRNWNNMALRDVVFSKAEPQTVYVGGKQGVWRSRDGGRHFAAMKRGFPSSAYLKDTTCLLLVEESACRRLFAGTRSGLYFCNPDDASWQPVLGKGLHQENIVDLLRVGDKILAFTSSACYASPVNSMPPDFSPHHLAPPEVYQPAISMFFFLLKLHDGSLLGLPGRLLIDMVGLALIFLSVSALYLWYVPWRNRKFPSRRKKARYFKFFYKYHFKIGIYCAFSIGLIALTGMLIWKPVYRLVMRHSVPASIYVACWSANPWHKKINKALYLPEEKKLLLSTRDGFFIGPMKGPGAFERLCLTLPVQRATVLKRLIDNRVLIGTFTNGIYVWDRNNDSVADLNDGRRGAMVTAAAVRDGRPLFWSDYKQGLVPFDRTPDPGFCMPAAMAEQGDISLWSFLLGLHNGRLFQDIVKHYWWIVQTGGLVLFLTTLSGTYDWLYHQGFFRKKN
jgi:hypothetical protein